MAAAASPLIAIVGPTGAGKSALALEVARRYEGEIVSCDSLQVYRGFDIGSAKVAEPERSQVRHHLVDVVEPDQEFSAAEYARLARAAVKDIAGRGRLPVVAGGTGLYMKALVEGLFAGPSRQSGLRQRIGAWADRYGDRRVHRLLAHLDGATALRVEPNDRVRVVRALEVFFATGRAISEHREEGAVPLEGFRVLTLGLGPDRAALRAAIERRTDAMLRGGLVGEVAGLLARGLRPSLRPLRAIGYRQVVGVVLGEESLEEARAEIVTETMRYAKRQMTWFRHQGKTRWCASAEEALEAVGAWLGHPGAEGAELDLPQNT
jgi:tRNA dimethylallyltransferase